MINYEIFDLLYRDFRDKFEEDKFVFIQKCVVGHQKISVYRFKEEEELEVCACLDFLNHPQEKFAYHNSWTPFCFTYFDNNNGIRVYKFICKNEDEKRMYDQFCYFAIS